MIEHPQFPRGNMYLSGGMEHADDLGVGWRDRCAGVLKDLEYYPLDIAQLDRDYTESHGELYYKLDPTNHLQYKSNFRKHFVYTDIQLVIHDTDAVIVLYDESARRGAGTVSECQIAYHYNIPVFVISDFEDWNAEVPSWLQALSTKIYTNFDDLYEYLERLPYGILKRDPYGNHHSENHYLCFLCGEPFEKHKTHFVSQISPLYCSSCVDLVKKTNEEYYDRYKFIVEQLEHEHHKEMARKLLKEGI